MITRTDVPPWDHQRRALDFALQREATMLGMGMGLGKTRVVVDLYQTLADRGRVRRALVVCPKAVVPHWPEEFVKWGASRYGIQVVTPDTVKNGVHRAVNIINYDRFWREPYKSWIKKAGFDLVVLDESHRIKSPGSKAARMAHSLTRITPYRVAMTGTPLHDTPLDVYSQYKFLDPELFGTRRADFEREYVEFDEAGPFVPHKGYVRVKGYKNQDEFRRRLDTVTFWAGSELLDLPPITYQDRYADLPANAKRIQRDLQRDFLAELQAGGDVMVADNVLVRLLRMQQLAGGTAVDTDGQQHSIHDAKAKLLADTLSDIPHSDPVVIFGVFRSDLDRIKKAAKAAERTYFEQSGRANDWRMFQHSVNPLGRGDVIGVQMKSGSAGIQLTRARHVIFYSTGFSRGDYLQAVKRLHRPGQEHKVSVIHLIMRGSVDEHVRRVLNGKGDVIRDMIGVYGG